MAWRVLFFQTARGDYPVQDFINEQDMPTQTKIASAIRLLIDYGPYLKPPYIKKLQNQLYELRISGKIAVRILYTIVHGQYYLLHVFKKKSRKIPIKELKTALDRIREIV